MTADAIQIEAAGKSHFDACRALPEREAGPAMGVSPGRFGVNRHIREGCVCNAAQGYVS